jgi:hypothetical protein
MKPPLTKLSPESSRIVMELVEIARARKAEAEQKRNLDSQQRDRASGSQEDDKMEGSVTDSEDEQQ